MESRKSLKFTATSAIGDPNAKYMVCTNTTALSAITGSYTMFMVMAPTNLEGTVFSQNAPLTATSIVVRNSEFTFISPNGIRIGQGSLSAAAVTENIAPNLSDYKLFSVRIKNTTDGILKANNLTFNLQRIQPFIPYSFGNNNMPITIGTQQMAGGINSNALTNTAISELLIYDRALSDIEFNQIQNYLSVKWNIPVAPPPTPTPTPTPTP